MTRLRVAVAGMGIGQAHLLAYLGLPDRFDVVALVEPDEQRRVRAASDWGVPHAVADVSELDGGSIDVIDLCTPPWLHEEHVTTALALGVHVICEKPLVSSLDAMDRIEALAQAAPGELVPVFQYRWGAGARRLRALIDAGLTGALRLVTSEASWWRDAAYYEVDWRGRWATEGGGVVHSHAVHLHDLVLWLGGPARSVRGLTTTVVNPIETEDTAAAVVELTTPSGRTALASLSATLGSVEEISRLRFAFERVSAESGTAPYEPGAEPWTFTFADEADHQRAERCWAELPATPDGYEGFLRDVHEALTTGSPLPVSLADARAALELTAAWYQSSRSASVVALPLSSDNPLRASLAP